MKTLTLSQQPQDIKTHIVAPAQLQFFSDKPINQAPPQDDFFCLGLLSALGIPAAHLAFEGLKVFKECSDDTPIQENLTTQSPEKPSSVSSMLSGALDLGKKKLSSLAKQAESFHASTTRSTGSLKLR